MAFRYYDPEKNRERPQDEGLMGVVVHPPAPKAATSSAVAAPKSSRGTTSPRSCPHRAFREKL